MRDSSCNNNREEDRNKDTPSPSTIDTRFNQTFRNTQGLLNCRSFPGKVLIMRRLDPLDQSGLYPPNTTRFSDRDFEHVEQEDKSTEDELQNRSSTNASSSVSHTKSLTMGNETTSKKMQKSTMRAKATDLARLTEELSGTTTILGSWLQWLLQMVIWLSSFTNLLALETQSGPSHFSSASMLASPPKSGIFEPIEISPAVIPHYSLPVGSLPPMYPTYPNTYDPVLTGRCPVNFSAISSIMEKTASDCNQPLAAVVGNVICCPQFSSLLHIFQGFYSTSSDNLVLQNAVADDCFKDIVSILASRGANSSLPTICSTKSSNLTGGSCPVKDISTFEKTVNTSKILEACSIVDPLKECCRPICQPVIMEAALKISGMQSFMNDNKNIVGLSNHGDMINDCKGVVYSWMSRKLPHDAANKAFRILSACKVNRACPLDLKQPSEVIAACHNVAAPSPSCCSSLNSYIAGIQRQMLITNRQAIICATLFGSILQKGGVMTNVYELCDVDIKDFSLQAYGQQGCLLRSLPADMVYDNSTGFSFTCDLSDNIAAPWPSSSSVTTLSLCAPEMSLPALPTSETLGNPGCRGGGVDLLVLILSIFVLTTLLL